MPSPTRGFTHGAGARRRPGVQLNSGKATCARGGPGTRAAAKGGSGARYEGGAAPGEFLDWPPRGRRASSPLAVSLRGGAAPAPRSSNGSPAGGCLGGRAARRSRLSRASAPAPGAAELGLISAGSWRPVRARAPRPNSMAIVRRPLCSGGGHFLRGWAGAGGRKRSKPRPRRRGSPSLGSEATATPLGRPGLGLRAGAGSELGSALSSGCPFSLCGVGRLAVCHLPRKLWWRSWKADGQRKVLRPRAAPPRLPSVPDPWQGVTGSKRTITASGRTQVPGRGNPTPTASLQQQEDLGLQVGTQELGE